ncbi:hypothetical protein BYT27DRAFT_6574926 [Phlegmacium glaucopus]|nr:hypothetical protein BYT27DRAFT_6574926 [Phlegmacium glaucopus]
MDCGLRNWLWTKASIALPLCLLSALPALKAWLDEHEASFDVLARPFFSTAHGEEIDEHLRSEYWGIMLELSECSSCPGCPQIILHQRDPGCWSNMQTPEFSEKSRLVLTGKQG